MALQVDRNYIQQKVRSILGNSSKLEHITNCIWKEIKIKQEIKPFTEEMALTIRINKLTRFYSEIF